MGSLKLHYFIAMEKVSDLFTTDGRSNLTAKSLLPQCLKQDEGGTVG